MSETVLDRLLDSLRRAANVSHAYQVRPAAVLWTDHEGQWQRLSERLREMLPELLILGEHAPAERRGPAIWIKCMLARTLEEADWPATAVPIIYLPGVSRADLRAIETCPRELQPLAELQYRGVYWSQTNGRDWSVNAFLSSSRGGLNLDVSGDQDAQDAMRRALDVLLDTSVEDLKGKRLEAADFDALLSSDPVRDLLNWIGSPDTTAAEWQGPRWDAFRSRCKAEWKLDPQADGALVAAERLAEGSKEWEPVWQRYCSGWRAFPTVIERLQQVSLPVHRDLFTDLSRYPKANDEAEAKLRTALIELEGLQQSDAISRLKALESEHGIRGGWLWAEMGRAPLAQALGPLARMAGLIGKSFGGQHLEDMAGAYRSEFWRVDNAARSTLARLRSKADLQAATAALKAIYVPWLEVANRRFQELVREDGYPGSTVIKEDKGAYQADGECWLFVDGLRFEVAEDLSRALSAFGLEVALESGWAPVPSVTASGKVACSPLAHVAKGRRTDEDFVPSHGALDKPLNTALLRKLLRDQGWQVLGANDAGVPTGRAWTEFGDLDHYGHEHGLRLAQEVPLILEAIVEQVRFLVDAGWKAIRIVTDHGWLLVPGGMPKTDLPKYLTATRWGRCASLTETASATSLTLTWSWCPDVRVAMAPGISSFVAGQEYGHGGLSLQESVIPLVKVTRAKGVADQPTVEIKEVKWTGLRCRVAVEGAQTGFKVDLRHKANDASTSKVSGGKKLTEGKVSLLVEKDELEGEAITVVVLDADGGTIAKVATVIGGED
jgi:hypothetical protein